MDAFRKNRQEATDKTNLTGVFMTIENIPYKYQSSKDDIPVLMVGTNYIYEVVGKDRYVLFFLIFCNYNYSKIKIILLIRFLKSLIDELQQLKHKRINLTSGKFSGKYINIRTIGFDGDNKALNELQGISGNFSNSECCRGCDSDNRAFQRYDQFNRPIRLLTNSHVLNGLIDAPMSYCFDFFHDLIGNIKCVLEHLIFNYYSNQEVEMLNDKIKQLKCDNGGIKLKFKSKSFKYTSCAQLIDFFIYFSYLDNISINKDDYDLYLMLRKIYNVHSKFDVSEIEIDDADKLISSLIMKLIRLKIRVKPKMHYMVHYKKFVQSYGPIIRHSTLRHERKNQQLVNDVKSSLNNKDVPLSVIKWYKKFYLSI